MHNYYKQLCEIGENMNHLETIIKEYCERKNYIVKNNIKVGRRKLGGWDMELDIIAYNPNTKDLLHIEPSIDDDSWEKREKRIKKKFDLGRKYIYTDIFPWLNEKDININQIAILINHPKEKNELAGAKIIGIDEFIYKVKLDIIKTGKMSNNAISEIFPLLRTIQLTENGYYKKL